MTSNGRQPKIAKFEYLSNDWADLSQTSNLDLYHQAKHSKPILAKFEYLSNHWSDLSQI